MSKILESIEIIRNLNSKKMNLYSHFYSGDNDTYIEAFNNVMRDNNINNEYYDFDDVEINKYIQKYKIKIDIEFDRLIEYGEILKKFHTDVDELLNDFIHDEMKKTSL
jgi:hypothetical protein